jgi:hypothetical protein
MVVTEFILSLISAFSPSRCITSKLASSARISNSPESDVYIRHFADFKTGFHGKI